jgi:hypothetical protein
MNPSQVFGAAILNEARAAIKPWLVASVGDSSKT